MMKSTIFISKLGEEPPTVVELGDEDRLLWEKKPDSRHQIYDEGAMVAEMCGDKGLLIHFDKLVVCMGRQIKPAKWKFMILDGDDRFPINDLFAEDLVDE